MIILRPQEYAELFESVKAQTHQILDGISGCHDFDHTLRVLHNARMISERAGGNLQVIEIAALCHDIGRREEIASKGKLCHAQIGADKTRNILTGYDLNEDFIKAVCNCVLKHRYRDELKPDSLEEKIVFDADKIDSIGAVGIARAFYFAGREGARLHNSVQEALNSSEYGLDDSAYREYLVKLRYMIKNLLTPEARELARPRARFMHEFFNVLNAETDMNKSSKNNMLTATVVDLYKRIFYR